MNEDEIQLVAGIRPEAPPYDRQAKDAARRGLVASAASGGAPGRGAAWLRPLWRRPSTMVLAGALAVTVGATAVVLVQARGRGPSGPVEEVVVAMPEIAAVSASEVLDRAARAAAKTDLDPRDDQFVKVESETMYGAFGEDDDRNETRYLYRTRRAIWLSADGTKNGVLRVEYLEPRAYPGWPIPEAAYEQTGVATMPLVSCKTTPEYARTDYAALKKLPTDAEGMRAHLYTGERGGNSRDEAAFTAAGHMLRETYLPPAQRAALFKAVGTIPGVDVSENAEDAAGRRGIGVGRVGLDGVRKDLLFDPETYEFLGERGIVVDEKAARAPKGSLVASTAQLSVTVADELPSTRPGFWDDLADGCPTPAG
ncbi:hypothetical protein GCM10010517_12110 [Streptosporangium fragile]|uniref:CU044_5270 family protein n=1 Tax=Streptosporangium fragile TaxID=46186 RepID=A0ABN3VRN4_9ACTN